MLAGGCTLRQSYPETQIRGYINGRPFSINAPKDSNLTGFDAVAETNGAIHVHIDSLQSTLNATNLANAASGQAAIVTATGQAINQAIQSAASTALKAAGVP
jgi:K+-transporting ATPase c subunit